MTSSSPKIRVGILFGGRSAEHEISILSARNVLAALDPARFEPVLVGIDHDGRWLMQDPQRLLASARDPRQVRIQDAPPIQMTALIPAQGRGAEPARIDVVFPVLHGTLGEDGAMQGLLEVAGLPYVGAGVLGSAIGMDKDVMKRLLRDAGIPVAAFRTLRRDAFDADPAAACTAVEALGLPLFTKPANAGSSVGVRKVKARAELPAAIRHAFEFDMKVVCEQGIDGREIELAVLGGTPPAVSVAGEIVVSHPDGFYSYDAKYIDDSGARLELPAHLTREQLLRAQQLALKTFEVLECEGMARVDMFLTAGGELYVNEINTIPGFTAISMYPKLWELSGVPPQELVSRLIDLALSRARRRGELKRSLTRE
ncbi:MAG TPA: D-alanine--D-alanine ligase family protein [Steroidobacteraceae bacterium]|nr:D-alanine--D-alanine ligase family protein [Steroidobacteraceae bacterium]